MPVTTICVQPVSGDGMFDEVEEGDFQIVTSHPSEMGYVPSMRRRCAQANVLSDLTDDQLSKLHTLYKTLEQEAEHESTSGAVIDRSILKSARYRTRRNAVDLSDQSHLKSSSNSTQNRVRVVEGEVCGGLRNVLKPPLQGNWVCG